MSELKESYDLMADKIRECRSKLEQRLADWTQYDLSRGELEAWLDENEAVFAGRTVLATDLKDKEAQLDKYRFLQ